MDHLTDWLHKFTSIPAPSGREETLANEVRANWASMGTVKTDRLGNLSLTVGSGDLHVAFAAHLDEVGFVVRVIDNNGFIGLNRLGGIPERVLLGQRILLLGSEGPVEGVIGTYPHHFTPEDAKYHVPLIADLHLDVGARSKRDVTDRLGIQVGDMGVYARSWSVTDNIVFSNSLDDRLGVVAISGLLKALQDNPGSGRVSFIASVQEEFNVRSLLPTVAALEPDILVVVDATPATDTPLIREYSDIALGRGPVVHLHSFHGRGTLGGVLPPQWLVNFVVTAAQESDIAIQRASFFGGITDGAFAQHLHRGIPTIEIGIPTRYTHSPVEVCSLRDLQSLVLLLHALTRITHEEVRYDE